MEKKKPDPQSAIGNDPFADIAPDVWEEVGVTPEAKGEDTPDETNPPSENTPPVIEIRDDADMALASWLYLDHTTPHGTPEEVAHELPDEDTLLSHLIDETAKKDKDPE